VGSHVVIAVGYPLMDVLCGPGHDLFGVEVVKQPRPVTVGPILPQRKFDHSLLLGVDCSLPAHDFPGVSGHYTFSRS